MIPNRQWKYLIIGEEMDIKGTDSNAVAQEAARNDIVIELASCVVLNVKAGDGEDIVVNYDNIPEQDWFTLPETK